MPFVSTKTPTERFWEKVEKTDTCWLWHGTFEPKGYGRFWVSPHRMKAHRFAYELLIGPLEAGLTIDHLCRNRACVNPEHLEAVDNRENILRGNGPAAINARKTHCIRGHEFKSDSTRFTLRANGHWTRTCLVCTRESTNHRRWLQRLERELEAIR